MSSLFKSIAKIAPIAASFIPGVGPVAGAAIGAAGGALSGGGLKGALLGGATGALGAGGSNAIGKAAGLSGVGLKAASGALTGAAGGTYMGGGLKGALLGAGLGGALGGLSGIASDPYGAIEAGGLSGKFAESGLGQAAIKGANALGLGSGAVTGAGTGAGSSSFGKIATIGSALNSYSAQDDMKEQLLEAQGKSEAALAPYLQSGSQANQQLSDRLSEGFNPGDLTQDPGYQFRLSQGQQGIDRTLGAKGKVFSGEALRAAQEFGQGLADQTYNEAYQRWLQGNQQLAGAAGTGLNAAGAATNVYDNLGNIGANATGAQSNILNGTLSSLLNGSGALDINGNPIQNKQNEQLLALLRGSSYGG